VYTTSVSKKRRRRLAIFCAGPCDIYNIEDAHDDDDDDDDVFEQNLFFEQNFYFGLDSSSSNVFLLFLAKIILGFAFASSDHTMIYIWVA
jgi:hypothetical protein